ncbi:hypothetical protein Agabi119p4_11537 [Agaricus bisporus var. burnettii]|uniref:Yeast cell wall synthesis Kre9/Knh1-like N-terminal domain-containing protein n=1 Tax=Agaricus bisporus var. burnettii TaxID=192524 RepID=A0A8H7BYI0_AGABI|nr:hypothetical protein Agabi119p4_11537 [Agaricus bisporus var. burnettii]
MPYSRPLYACTLISVFLFFITTSVSAYFLIDEPSTDTQWVNNEAYSMRWKKGRLDGIVTFDVEMARLNSDGLVLVAKNVPATQESLNIFVQDLPSGDDYFLVFINSTHGVMYATSPRFSILDSGSNPTNKGLEPDSTVPTVTVNGGPNPTKAFSTTFPALPQNGAVGIWPGSWELLIIGFTSLLCVLAGGVRTML